MRKKILFFTLLMLIIMPVKAYDSVNYTIKFNKLGGSGGTNSAFITYTKGEDSIKIYTDSTKTTQIQQIQTPIKKGYQFDGYYLKDKYGVFKIITKLGNPVSLYASNDQFNNDIFDYMKNSSGTITATPKWKKLKYRLNLKAEAKGKILNTYYFADENDRFIYNKKGQRITNVGVPKSSSGKTFLGYYYNNNGVEEKVISETGEIIINGPFTTESNRDTYEAALKDAYYISGNKFHKSMNFIAKWDESTATQNNTTSTTDENEIEAGVWIGIDVNFKVGKKVNIIKQINNNKLVKEENVIVTKKNISFKKNSNYKVVNNKYVTLLKNKNSYLKVNVIQDKVKYKIEIHPIISTTKTTKENRIFIGDSKTVGMHNAVGDNEKDIWSAESSMGIEWMKSTGVPAIENKIGKNSKVIILMGINDMGSSKNTTAPQTYAKYINTKAKKWAKKGAKTYFVSMTPMCKGGTTNRKNKIIKWSNNQIKSRLSNKVKYINAYKYLINNGYGCGNDSTGVHYNDGGATYKKIYNFIIKKL